MNALTLAFLVLTAATVAVSFKRADARIAAFVLAASSILSLICNRMSLAADTVLSVNLTCDILAALGFVIAWRLIWPPRNWLFALALTFLAQVMAHYAYHPGPGAAYRLQVVLNILYALQLATVVIGPRVAEWIGHARGAFRNRGRGSRGGVRGRGVVATADSIFVRVGGWLLDRPVREKSR